MCILRPSGIYTKHNVFLFRFLPSLLVYCEAVVEWIDKDDRMLNWLISGLIGTWLTTSTAALSQLLNQTSPPPLHPPPPSSRSNRGQLSSLSSSSLFFLVYWLSAASGSYLTPTAACHLPPGQTTWRRIRLITGFPDRQPERQQPWQLNM